MNIKVYAPCNGKLSTLETLKDGVFSEKMLGDGFVFKSSDSSLFSPVDIGTLDVIAKEKNAFFFNIDQDVNLLLHIGIGTIDLGGKPFKVIAKANEVVNLESKIVEVDFKKIEKENLDTSCTLTIENKSYKFNLIKKTIEVKKGELIGEFVEEIKNEAVTDDVRTYFTQKNKYEKMAIELNSLVGSQTNYEQVYNCYTRLRFKIKDKDVVKVDEIKKVNGVKGVIWNDDEIQIVIGQDVYKVKDAVVLDNENKLNISDELTEFKVKKNNSKARTLLGAAVQIMVPLIPVLIGAGMLLALVSILQITKLMPYFKFINPDPTKIAAHDPSAPITGQNTWYIFNNNQDGPQPPMGWALLFIISSVSLRAISVFACISTARYLKFNIPYSAALGLIITAPGFLLDCSGISFVLFRIPGISNDSNFKALQNILITGQGVSILVAVGTILMAKILDDWIKKWIPSSIDMSFRPFIVMLAVSIFSLFIFTPIWYVISSIIAGLINYTKNWYGIGIGLYAIALQICITFGIHLALSASVPMNEYYTHLQQNTILYVQTHGAQGGMAGFSYFWPGTTVGSWGQLGAVIAIIILTKDRKLRRDAGSTVVTGFFGVTEPIIFGITLPKFVPWVTGTAGAALGGLFAGYMKCSQRIQSGLGIFEFFGYYANPIPGDGDTLTAFENTLFIAIACCISLGAGIGLTMLFYKERKEEWNYIQQLTNKIKTYIKVSYILNKKQMSENRKELINKKLKEIKNCLTRTDKIQIKQFEKTVFTILNIQDTITITKEREEKRKASLLIKGRKLVEKNKLSKAEIVKKDHSTDKIKDKISIIENKLRELNYQKTIEEIRKFSNEHIPTQKVIELANLSQLYEIEKLIPNFTNALNALLIDYNIDKPIEEFDLDYELSLKQIQLKETKQQAKLAK